jgi:DNA-binding CsgD family transcriptional regulator
LEFGRAFLMIDIQPELLSRVIADIYEGAYDQGKWPDTIESLCNLFHGSKACLARIGPDLQPDDSITTSFDPKFHQIYVDELADLPNPLVDAVGVVPVGTIYHDHAIAGESLRKSRFWNEWMAPQDMYGGIASKLMISGPSFWMFDVQRGRHQDKFDANDLELLQYLAPHLVRATKISRQFKSMQPLVSAFSHLPFGAIVVDAHMRIIASNVAAEKIMLRPGSLLTQVTGHLVAKNAESMSALHRMIVDACRARDGVIAGTGGDLMIRSGNALRPANLSVSIGPLAGTALDRGPFLQPCAAIFVREINLDVQAGFELQARNLFGFTVREASLAASLASGRSVREAAEDAGIAYSTMRTYLENVFRKTETRQQSQLVALLRSLQPPIQS